MKKNKFFIICIFVFMLCACNKRDELSNNNDTEFYKRYYENDIVDYYDVNESKHEIVESSEEENNNLDNNIKNNKQSNNQTSNTYKDNNKTESTESKITENNKQEEDNSSNETSQTIETPKEEIKEDMPVIINDNSVDENNIDYSIHGGRIDCNDVDSCVSISIPMQVKFKKSISNAFYVEVIAKNDTTLGYFIQYIFVEYNYGSYDKCSTVGDDIKQTLSNKVIGYDCSSEGILKVKTNY